MVPRRAGRRLRVLVRLEPRGEASRLWVYATPFLAVGLTVLGGAAIFALMGRSPLEGLYQFFIAPIGSLYGLSELFVKATPIVLIAVGLALGFRANVWNIGAEGQLTIGAIAATRSSTAAVSQVVHPRFDAPVTRKLSIVTPWSAM